MRVYHVRECECELCFPSECGNSVMVANISEHLRSLALGSYKAQELLCSRKLKMIRLLCGWKLKPKELLCTDILAREELYQDVTQRRQERSNFSSMALAVRSILHVKRHSNYD